jgi:hypothetical protein
MLVSSTREKKRQLEIPRKTKSKDNVYKYKAKKTW